MAELMFFMRVLVLYESPLRRPPTGNSTERPAMRERERKRRSCGERGEEWIGGNGIGASTFIK